MTEKKANGHGSKVKEKADSDGPIKNRRQVKIFLGRRPNQGTRGN